MSFKKIISIHELVSISFNKGNKRINNCVGTVLLPGEKRSRKLYSREGDLFFQFNNQMIKIGELTTAK